MHWRREMPSPSRSPGSTGDLGDEVFHARAPSGDQVTNVERDPRIGLDANASSRILVVDDEAANLRLLEHALTLAGYTDVVCTTDPEEAVSLAREVEPDLLLLDLHLPGLDGLAALAQIREVARPGTFLPVVILTADITLQAKRRALAAGADDLLTKPFDRDEVVLRVRNLLRTKRLHAVLERERSELEARVGERTAALRNSLERLLEADEARRNLLDNLVRAQEKERQLIANDIHDDTVQVMTAVSVRLSILRQMLPPDEHADDLARLESSVAEAIQRLRRLLFDLRPFALDDHGLGATLHEIAARGSSDVAIEVEDRITAEPRPELQVILFRIAQEALINAEKHAHASRIGVLPEEEDGGYLVSIDDDGRGFDVDSLRPESGHLGLPSMRERAEMAGGWLVIDSAPGAGTTVRCWLLRADAAPSMAGDALVDAGPQTWPGFGAGP